MTFVSAGLSADAPPFVGSPVGDEGSSSTVVVRGASSSCCSPHPDVRRSSSEARTAALGADREHIETTLLLPTTAS
jgi:hypothetical protein